MLIGVFGGSFDPVHLGHLILAEQCREQAGLDEVWFVPAAVAPHKRAGATGSGRQRREMLEFAIAGHEHFRVVDHELRRGETSFTVDTLREFRTESPEHSFRLILGADSLAGMESWREPQEICQLAPPLVYARSGTSIDWSALARWCDSESLARIRDCVVDSMLIDISSTAIRHRVAAGRSIRYLVPRSVEKYIQTSLLYAKDQPAATV